MRRSLPRRRRISSHCLACALVVPQDSGAQTHCRPGLTGPGHASGRSARSLRWSSRASDFPQERRGCWRPWRPTSPMGFAPTTAVAEFDRVSGVVALPTTSPAASINSALAPVVEMSRPRRRVFSPISHPLVHEVRWILEVDSSTCRGRTARTSSGVLIGGLIVNLAPEPARCGSPRCRSG